MPSCLRCEQNKKQKKNTFTISRTVRSTYVCLCVLDKDGIVRHEKKFITSSVNNRNDNDDKHRYI